MNDLRELYQEVIFDHNRSPRNYGEIKNATHKAEGFNPVCGDQLTVYMLIDDTGMIKKISFKGQGCAISIASASLMSEELMGKNIDQATQIFEIFHDVITAKKQNADIGKLEVLKGVKAYPIRVKCATLAWHTSHAAMHRLEDSITTE